MVDSRWNDEALRDVFFKGLNSQLKDELMICDLPSDLQSLVSLAIRLDGCFRERRREQASTDNHSPFPPPPVRQQPLITEEHSPSTAPRGEEPMQQGRVRLTPEERQRRIRAGECLYCRNTGHRVATCPVWPKERTHQ